MKCLNCIALILVVLGALNWGLWGFFQFDFVAWLCKGNTTGMARVVYAIVGLAGVWGLGFFCRMKKVCCCNCKCHCGEKGGKGSCH